MIDVKALTATYETQLRERGVRLADVLAEAGVDRSTWTRWKQGQSPNMAKWGAVEERVQAALANGTTVHRQSDPGDEHRPGRAG